MSDWSYRTASIIRIQQLSLKQELPLAGLMEAVGEGFLSKPVVCINLKNCTFSYFSFHSGIINQRKNLFVSITNCAGEI